MSPPPNDDLQQKYDAAMEKLSFYEKQNASILIKEFRREVNPYAVAQGIPANLLDIVEARGKEFFSLNQNGDIRGINGMTGAGWISHVLKKDAGYLFTNAPNSESTEPAAPAPAPKPVVPSRIETPRERLDRANGYDRQEIFK